MMGEALLVVGAAFILLAAVGMVRFTDVFTRMQVLTKASTFGLLTVLAGGIVSLTSANDVTTLVLAGLLHLVTTPVGSNLLARATYFAEGIGHGIDTVDELSSARKGLADDS
ncbi:MAG: monovalent cation/H(+) antiporter subunit G [Acidimicrobiales bacterium]